jgi:hypothetical protein
LDLYQTGFRRLGEQGTNACRFRIFIIHIRFIPQPERMHNYAAKIREKKDPVQAQPAAGHAAGQAVSQPTGEMTDAITPNKWHAAANSSSHVQQLKGYQQMADTSLQAGKAARLQEMAATAEHANAQQAPPATGAPIQRYRLSEDKAFNVSEGGNFAVSTGAYPTSLYVSDDAAPLALAGGLAWNEGETADIDNEEFTEYVADISAYEENGTVGSEQHCGAFARGITGDNGSTGGDDRSIGAPGSVLKDSETSPGQEEGWENHFAAVVKRDGGDHATFETAVGIPHTWVGIYGVNKGQTFKYKTQVANIERLSTMAPVVLPGQGPYVKGFWDYLLCRRGRRGDLVVPRGISMEQAQVYQDELTAWRDNGTLPESPFMAAVVQRLIAELEETGGE